MKHLLILSSALLSTATFAQAAPSLPPLVGASSSSQGILPLPDGVQRVVAVDAQNTILAQMRPDNSEPLQYHLLQVKHVYAGGIAMLFKGSGVIPTGPFVSPGFAQGGNFGGGQNGGNQGQQGQQGNGFLFPQGGLGQQGNLQFTPNGSQLQRPQNQPGLNLGTPIGNFFLPGKVTN